MSCFVGQPEYQSNKRRLSVADLISNKRVLDLISDLDATIILKILY